MTQPIFANEKSTRSLTEFDFVHDPTDKSSKLGVGSFASVKLAKEKKTGKQLAIKIISMDPSKMTNSDLHNIRTEISVHRNLDHQNIIKFHDYIQKDNSAYLIIDYAPSGNLYSYIHKRKTLSPEEIFRFFYQTCLAIQYLHQNDILHRDMKPENLLLDKERNIKLCDFGWAARRINEKRMTFCGTYEYMAPEIVNKKPYDYRVDIWSLGILLYELMHREAPYKGRSLSEIAKSFNKTQIVFSPTINPDAKDLILKILKNNPNERLSIAQILSHPWVQSHLSTEQDECPGAEETKILPKEMKLARFQSLDSEGFKRHLQKDSQIAKPESTVNSESRPQTSETKSRRNISSLNTCASLREVDFEKEKTVIREKSSIANTSSSDTQKSVLQDSSLNRLLKTTEASLTSRGHAKSSSSFTGSVLEKLGVNDRKVSQEVHRKKKIFETTLLSPNLRSKVDSIILQLSAHTTSHKSSQSVFFSNMTTRNPRNQQPEQNPTNEPLGQHHHNDKAPIHYVKSQHVSKGHYDSKGRENDPSMNTSQHRPELDMQHLKDSFQRRIGLIKTNNYIGMSSSASTRNLTSRPKPEIQACDSTNLDSKYSVAYKHFHHDTQKQAKTYGNVLSNTNENKSKVFNSQEIDISINKSYREFLSKRKIELKINQDLEANKVSTPCSVDKRNENKAYKKELFKDKENYLKFREECLSK